MRIVIAGIAAIAAAGVAGWFVLGGGASTTPATTPSAAGTHDPGAGPVPEAGPAAVDPNATPTLPPRRAAPGEEPHPTPEQEASPDRVFPRGLEDSHAQAYEVEVVDGKARWHIGQLPPPEDAPGVQATLDVLTTLGTSTIASVKWKDVPVSDAAAELARASGIAIDVAEDVGALPVRVALKETCAHEALTFLCRSAQVAFDVTDGRVRIRRAPNPVPAPAEKPR
jgi:hypothetical protein